MPEAARGTRMVAMDDRERILYKNNKQSTGCLR